MDESKDVCNVSVDVNQMSDQSDKSYKDCCLAKILTMVCALLNSVGGILHLNFKGNSASEEKQETVSNFVKALEQRIIEVIGQCKYDCLVEPPSLQTTNEQYNFEIRASPSLCTVHYNLYLPTMKQVNPILPWAPIKDIIQRFNRVLQPQQMPETKDLILDQKLSFTESPTTQFKNLKAEKSKRVSLADRIIKYNKLLCCVSAFANKYGGCIYYGITDKGVVKGEYLGRNDLREIVTKVTKAINKMIWLEGKLERGKHWNIKFVPVKDKNMNIPSLFVIIVSVEPLPGGVFAQQPESYYRVNGDTEGMPFNVWKHRFFNGRTEDVPQCVGRIRWSSERNHTIYNRVSQALVKHGNDANFDAFKRSAMQAKNNYKANDIEFIILKEEIVIEYKKGSFQKANRMLDEYKQHLLDTHTQDPDVLYFFAIHIKSAILRAKGNYQQSYDVAKEGLQLAGILPAGIYTAWFYNHVAIVEKKLSQETAEVEARCAYSKASKKHFLKALQHTEASNVDQTFPDIVADAKERIHIFRAIACLGNFASGADFGKATQFNVKEAQDDLIVYKELVKYGHEPTNYRVTYSSLAMSDLFLSQWSQQQRQQQQLQQRPCDTEADISLVVKSFCCASKAHELANQFCFEELKIYAKARMAVATEVMIIEKFKKIRQKFQK